jgi:hypothetical protein
LFKNNKTWRAVLYYIRKKRRNSLNSPIFIGILDRLSVGVAAAYSLRKLRTAYTGTAIRVRRSSDNAELDVGFTASNDLDTAALLAHVGSGSGFVTTWYDQSSNVRNATQITAGSQPRIVSNGVLETVNGKPGINYVMNKGLVITTFGTTIAQSFSVLVSPFATWQTYHAIIDTGNSSATRSGAITNFGSQGLLPTPPPLSLYRNGISVTPNSTNCLNPISTPFQVTIEHIIYNHASACIGNIESGTGGGCAIQSETIVFSGAVLSTTDRQTLERNQGTYYGITVA